MKIISIIVIDFKFLLDDIEVPSSFSGQPQLIYFEFELSENIIIFKYSLFIKGNFNTYTKIIQERRIIHYYIFAFNVYIKSKEIKSFSPTKGRGQKLQLKGNNYAQIHLIKHTR